jgi:hypothetical protein
MSRASYRDCRRWTLHASLAVALSFTLGGCTDYLSRRDTLTLGTGDSVQANMSIHVIDPSPPGSNKIVRDIDGERVQHGIERYRNPQAGLGGGGSFAPSVPVGATAAPPVGNPLNR